MLYLFRRSLYALCLGVFALSAQSAIITNAWVPIFKGVDFTRAEADADEERQQKVSAFRVDLTDPDVEMFSTPAGGPLETIGQTTTTFVNTYGVAAGVNANFFSPVSTTPDDPRTLSGLAISEGNLVSPTEEGRPVLLITRSNVASIAQNAPANLGNVWTAVAGSNRILINGAPQLEECDTSFCNENPRTAAGISADDRYLYLMVIDGRQEGWSDGATLFETGEWLKRLGAHQGLNLDGGGSSAMAKMEDGAAVLLNRLNGGVQRVNGNHLGFYAPAIAPVVLTQPDDQTANVGTNVTFTATIGGTTPLHHQWQFNGTNIIDATNTTFMLTNITTAARGEYTLVISNAVGVTSSSNALLTVVVPLDITNLTVIPRPGSAVITWTSDPETISQIEYGISPNYGNFSVLETSPRTEHKFLLTGLLPDNNYQFRIISHIDDEELVSDSHSFSTDLEFIVDNPQATYSGVWTIGSAAPDKFGDYYQYAPTTSSGSPTAETRFAPPLTTPGKYDVAVWYPQGTNRTTKAPVLLAAKDGLVTANINQQTGGGAWQPVAAAVNCDPAGVNFALLRNNTGENNAIVIADAMRWSYVTAQDIPAEGEVPAWWSEFYFATNVNASLDPDGDSYSTHSEYVIGTDPTDANSRLELFNERTATGLNINFTPLLVQRIYQLQSSTSLGGVWTTLPNAVSVTNSQGSFSVTNVPQTGAQFYRLSVKLAP